MWVNSIMFATLDDMHDHLPTRSRHINGGNSDCPICNKVFESTLHAFRDWDRVKKLWKLLVKQKYWDRFFSHSTLACWIDHCLSGNFTTNIPDLPWDFLFREVVGVYWFWRNRAVYHQEEPPPVKWIANNIVYKTRELVSVSYRNCNLDRFRDTTPLPTKEKSDF